MSVATVVTPLGAVVLIAVGAVLTYRLFRDREGGPRFADRYASVTSRAWEGMCLGGWNGWLVIRGGNRRVHFMLALISLGMAASTLVLPYLALRQTAHAGSVLATHPLAAGIAALVYTLLLEVVELPDRLHGLKIVDSQPTSIIALLAIVSAGADIVFGLAGFSRPASAGAANAAYVGAAYVAVADLVSLGWALFLSQTAGYPISPVIAPTGPATAKQQSQP